MKVLKPECSEVIYRTLLNTSDEQMFAIGLMTLFPLHKETEIDVTQPGTVWRVAQQALGIDAILDEGWPKHRSEFLVYGSAHARDGFSAQPLSVIARVGDVSKTLAVFGDRQFNPLGMIGSPAAFSRIPIVPATAYGGSSCLLNPAGKGASEVSASLNNDAPIWPLPNVEYPSKLMVQRKDEPPPAGFWALAADSAQRQSFLGKFDTKWLHKRWPHLPVDTDVGYFQVAPEDQQFKGFLKGDEPVDLQNMHPRIKHIESALPAMRARIFLEKTGLIDARNSSFSPNEAAQSEFVELTTNLETVWLFPEMLCGVLLHRAVTNVFFAQADDVSHIYVALESMVDTPNSFAYHQDKFNRLVGRTVDVGAPDNLTEDSGESDRKATEPDQITSEESSIESEAAVDATAVTKFVESIEREIYNESPEIKAAMQKLEPLMQRYGVTLEDAEKMLAKDQNPALTFTELQQQVRDLGPKLVEYMKKTGISETDLVQQMTERSEMQDYATVLAQSPNGLKGLFDQLDQLYAELIEEEKQIDLRAAQADSGAKVETVEEAPEAESPDEMDARLLVTDLRQLVITRHARKRDLKGLDLSGVDLSDLTLEGADFSGANLAEANFEKSRLQNCRFDEALLSQARFGGADLSGASLQEVSATQADFTNCRMVKANLTRSDFSESKFQKAQISGSTITFADFSRAVMQDVDASGCQGEFAGFTESQLTGSNFSDANLRGVNFTGANLQQVNLSKASLKRGVLYSANFTDAVCNQATLPDSVADEKTIFVRTKMIEADFSGAVWNRSRFEGVDMSRAQMSGADLTGAQLNNVRIIRAVAKNMILAKASVVDCDLTGANFFEGSFSNAQLARCKLQLANFFGVDFSDTVLEVCDLEGSIIDRTILQARGKSA